MHGYKAAVWNGQNDLLGRRSRSVGRVRFGSITPLDRVEALWSVEVCAQSCGRKQGTSGADAPDVLFYQPELGLVADLSEFLAIQDHQFNATVLLATFDGAVGGNGLLLTITANT